VAWVGLHSIRLRANGVLLQQKLEMNGNCGTSAGEGRRATNSTTHTMAKSIWKARDNLLSCIALDQEKS